MRARSHNASFQAILDLGGRGLSACGGYALRAAAMGSKLALLRAYAAALSVNGYPHASSGSTT